MQVSGWGVQETLCSLWQGSQTAFSPDALFYVIWKSCQVLGIIKITQLNNVLQFSLNLSSWAFKTYTPYFTKIQLNYFIIQALRKIFCLFWSIFSDIGWLIWIFFMAEFIYRLLFLLEMGGWWPDRLDVRLFKLKMHVNACIQHFTQVNFINRNK